MNLRVRQIRKISYDGFFALLERLGPLEDWFLQSSLMLKEQSDRYIEVIAVYEGRAIVGVGFLFIEATFAKDGKVARLWDISFRNTYAERAGLVLCRYVEQKALEYGCCRVVINGGTERVDLFQKFGYYIEANQASKEVVA